METPRSKEWHILDYVLTRARDRRDVHITWSMPGADDCWTDHRLLISRFNIQIRRPPKRISAKIPHRWFDCEKLYDPRTSQSFRDDTDKNLNELDLPTNASVKARWTTLRDAMCAATNETIGFKRKKNQDLFDENDKTITSLIEVKRHARLAFENNTSVEQMRHTREGFARPTQNTWWQQNSENLKVYWQTEYASFLCCKTGDLWTHQVISWQPKKCRSFHHHLGHWSWNSHFEGLLNNHPCTPNDLPQDPATPYSLLDVCTTFTTRAQQCFQAHEDRKRTRAR